MAGDADILLVPDLEAGNMLVKNLVFLSRADAAGVVLGGAGTHHPRRAAPTTKRTRFASCAVAALYAMARAARARTGGELGSCPTRLLVLNAGSSSIKFSVYEITEPATGLI